MSFFSMAKTLIESTLKKAPTVKVEDFNKIAKPISRGHIEIEIDKCIFCGICSKRCPTHAIEVQRPNAQWSIERMKCIQCNCCSEVCPKKCLSMNNQQSEAGYAKVKEVFTGELKVPPKPANVVPAQKPANTKTTTPKVEASSIGQSKANGDVENQKDVNNLNKQEDSTVVKSVEGNGNSNA